MSIVFYGMAGKGFTRQLFLASGFVNAVPGILLHLLVIPPVVRAARRII